MSDAVGAAGAPEREHHWQSIDGVDPASATFPLRAKAGDDWVLIFKAGVGYRAVERTCPHQQASLMDAVLMANGTILRCNQHNFAFRLSDGKGVNCAGLRLKVYDVREAGGRLEVAL